MFYSLAPPQRPLFPSAVQVSLHLLSLYLSSILKPTTVPTINSTGLVSAEKEPTLFQAPSTSSNFTSSAIANAPLVVSLPENSLLMHPKEDLSMVSYANHNVNY